MYDEFVVETLQKMGKPGLLLVSARKDRKKNVMAIGWGFVGVMWRKKVFVVLVRPTRLTHEFLNDLEEFTVNVPSKGMEKIVDHCGTVSGREHNKFRENKLHLRKGKKVKVPVIKECKIHYECRVIHRLKIDPKLVSKKVKKELYPKRDFHTMFFGEILAAY